jgi:hypothetical protein
VLQKVACGAPGIEAKIEIVLLAEKPRVELKSSANESWRLPGSNAPSFIAIQSRMAELWSEEDPKNSQIATTAATHIVGSIANEL